MTERAPVDIECSARQEMMTQVGTEGGDIMSAVMSTLRDTLGDH